VEAVRIMVVKCLEDVFLGEIGWIGYDNGILLSKLWLLVALLCWGIMKSCFNQRSLIKDN